MKKYELVEDDQIVVGGHTLYRLRALRDFGNVKAGDLGGYIEKESNLSHEWNCWVYDDAKVYGGAWVYGGARVFGGAQVYGGAMVFHTAQVYGDAQVFDDAQVFGDARVFSVARVYDDAKVYGGAWVCGGARVCGNAQVYGGAWVSGNARVYGGAKVFGDAQLTGYANVSTPSEFVVFTNVGSENGTLTVYKGKDGNLLATRGCFTGTLDEFLVKSKRVHNKSIHREYKLLIDVAKLKILGEKQ